MALSLIKMYLYFLKQNKIFAKLNFLLNYGNERREKITYTADVANNIIFMQNM